MIDLETRKIKNNKGFTLVEILVSVAIFSLVFGAVASLYAANIRAQKRYLDTQKLLSEAGYVMSYMSYQLERGLTQGESNCSSDQCFSGPSDNISYQTTSYRTDLEGVVFVSYRGECVEFYPSSTISNSLPRLYQKVRCSLPALVSGHLTSSDLEIEKFKVKVIRGSQKAPRVTLYLKIKTTGKDSSSIDLQTTISKRKF